MRRPKRTVRVGEARVRCAVMRVVCPRIDVRWLKAAWAWPSRAEKRARVLARKARSEKTVFRASGRGLLPSLINALSTRSHSPSQSQCVAKFRKSKSRGCVSHKGCVLQIKKTRRQGKNKCHGCRWFMCMRWGNKEEEETKCVVWRSSLRRAHAQEAKMITRARAVACRRSLSLSPTPYSSLDASTVRGTVPPTAPSPSPSSASAASATHSSAHAPISAAALPWKQASGPPDE